MIPFWCRKYAKQRHRSLLGLVVVLVCGVLFGADPSGPWPVQADTYVIPSFTVSERYDTNIYMAPAQFLPPGTRLNDFATTLQGNVKVLHKSRDVQASLTGGVDGNAYLQSTGLNYYSTRVDGFANLDGLMGHLANGAQLHLYENFRYTPVSPGFLTGAKAGADDPFLRGIQSFRANTFSNTVSADGVYPVFRGLGLQGRYSFSTYRVGSILAGGTTGATFFDTNVHTWSAGPRVQVTRADSVALLYQQSAISQTQTTGNTLSIDTTAHALLATYTRVMPDWTFAVAGGATLVEPAGKTFPTGSIRFSTNPDRSTMVQIDLSRQAAPSFFLAAGALISNVGQVQITHRLSRLLTLRGSANYGFNEIIPADSNTKFTNLTLSAGLNYKLTRTMAVDLFYDHNDFKTESPGLNYIMLRNVVGLALTAEWK